jgi:hypothetical protein
MKSTIEKQTAAAQKRVQKFIDTAFDDLKRDVAAQFAVARMAQEQANKK